MAGISRFRLDPSARRIDGGRVLLGGSPLRLFRLSRAGATIVDQISAGEELSGKHEALTDRLVDAGAIHPAIDPTMIPRFTSDDVTLVIPTLGGSSEHLTALVAATGAARAIVVDDASATPVEQVGGASVQRLNSNVGPGGARAAGFAQVATPLVAFVDTDVALPDRWMSQLLGHFDDPQVGLVAPRVRSVAGASTRERYEMWRSPLDLGPSPARIRAGSRVSYVPGAAFIARTEALRAIDGFDATLRWGEDVDLVWRLDAADWRCRYEPAVEVVHEPKSSWRGWARQRYSYGTSAAPLARQHPGALAPARVSGWSALSWLLLVGGRFTAPVGVLTALGTTAALARKLRPMEQAPQEAVRLAGLGHVYAGRILASALIRAWWPFAAIAAVFSHRARRTVVAAAVIPALLDWRNDRPDLGPATAVGLRLADDLAYGVGLWRGVFAARSVGALVPDLSNWPGKRTADSAPVDPDRVRER